MLTLPAASGPPVGRRWPAGLPAVAGRPAAAADPPTTRQCLPPSAAGGRRGSNGALLSCCRRLYLRCRRRQRYRRRATISTVTAMAVIMAARRSRWYNGPCRGRAGFAHAGRPCGTASVCLPPRARRLAAAGPPDQQPSLARPRPPLARRIARPRLPPVGRRRPARVERRSQLMLPQPLAKRSCEPVQPCSHCSRRPFTTMPFTSDCGHVSD